MFLLGLGGLGYKDSAAAILSDGRLVAAAAEERFSGNKHEGGFPHRAVRFCLERAGIGLAASAAAAKILRRHISKAATEVSRYFLDHDTAIDTSTSERVTEAFETLRPVGLEAVQLIFAQEMEKALRKAVETGKATDVVRRSS